jgi:hypothetical protein
MTHKAPMKIRKSTLIWLVWTLAFFLVTAGFAQGAEHCKGKCCQGPREPATRENPLVHGPEVLGLQLIPKTPLDAFLPSCHLSGPSGDQKRVAVSEKAPCRDEGAPSCCHMGKAGSRVQALISQGHSWGTDRPFHADMVVCVQSHEFLDKDQRRLIVDGWNLQPRAAPVPLYLKNTSFIC